MRRLGFLAAIVVLSFYCLAPFLWQVLTSLKPASELVRLPPLLPSHITLEHYIAVFEGQAFLRIIANSFIVAAGTTFLALGLGASAAFALAKLKVRRERLILLAVLSVSMFPPIATVSPLYLIIRALGLRDTLLSLIITYTSFSLPLAIWVLNRFMRDIPQAIYWASRVDGCSVFQSFVRVILPLAMPGLMATAILVFIFAWNEFLFALTFTATPRARTVPVAIALFPGIHEMPWGEIMAASVVVTLPIVVLVFVFQRRIVEGLTAGAVRG